MVSPTTTPVPPRAGLRSLVKGHPVYHRHDAHIIDIRLPEGIEPFRLTRKRDTYSAAGGGRPMRFIESIEPCTAEAVCISVAAADSLYTTEDFLLTHNTLNDSFIILDEAQNTSAEQMKMFLTRLGFGSRVVVTGDVTQVDLPAVRSAGSAWCRTSWTASRTSTSRGSPATTSYGTGWSARSSTRTSATTRRPSS